jgi:hypothetical protein
MTCTVASFARPTIVDVEVLVTGILESEGDHKVCYFQSCICSSMCASSVVLITL